MTELHGCSEPPLAARPIDWKAVAAAVRCAESEHGAAMALGGRSLEQLAGSDWVKAPSRPFTIISASSPARAAFLHATFLRRSRKSPDLRRKTDISVGHPAPPRASLWD